MTRNLKQGDTMYEAPKEIQREELAKKIAYGDLAVLLIAAILLLGSWAISGNGQPLMSFALGEGIRFSISMIAALVGFIAGRSGNITLSVLGIIVGLIASCWKWILLLIAHSQLT